MVIHIMYYLENAFFLKLAGIDGFEPPYGLLRLHEINSFAAYQLAYIPIKFLLFMSDLLTNNIIISGWESNPLHVPLSFFIHHE